MKLEFVEGVLHRIKSGKWKWYHLVLFMCLSALVIFCVSYLNEKGKQIAKGKSDIEASYEKNNIIIDTTNQEKIDTVQNEEKIKPHIKTEKLVNN